MQDDEVMGRQAVRYLTLTDKNGESENRYYVSLTGRDAETEWQAGDSLILELGFCAYKHGGQWHMSHRSDSIRFVEMDIQSNNILTRKDNNYGRKGKERDD